jgi:PHD/YefM family antitoxin component YafN of YafNO toxin-antitoxin module
MKILFYYLSIFRKEVCEMPQIIPIKDLKNTSEISDMCHRTDEPIYITKNGYGDMVIMGMEVYENTMRQLAIYRDVEVSEQQIETGHVRDARTALAEMRKKHGL